MKTSRKNQLFRRLLAATLLLGGTFQLAAPVLAVGTAAGTSINNTATGTYQDPNDPNTTINTTSNTVTIKVAEVAGITITGTAINDVNGGSIQAADVVNYDFTVTNVGNDPTRFFIPDTALVNGGTRGTMQYSTDNGATFTNVPAGGFTTASIPADGKVLVRVPVTVSSTAGPNSTVSVQLGNTATAGDQNVAYAAGPTAGVGDVYTQDNPDGAVAGESVGAPGNGAREASVTQSSTVGSSPNVQNGPQGAANAAGPTSTADPTGTNSDFTNASTAVPSGLLRDQSFDPALRTITNTVKNSSADAVTVTLLPTKPSDPAALPAGTQVTIKYGTSTATYTYDPANPTGFSPATGTTAPVTIPLTGTGAGTTADYQVTIDLPANSPQFKEFPVAIAAFNDINRDGLLDATTEAPSANTTIDRLYTGFVRLDKTFEVLQGTGPVVQNGQPAPGNIIKYTITYTNVSGSAPTGGSGNKILNAGSFVITEDGTVAPNNWAVDNDKNGTIDTSNAPGTATASSGTITYFNGTAGATGADTNVTRYVLDLSATPVAPGGTGTFTLQRKVN